MRKRKFFKPKGLEKVKVITKKKENTIAYDVRHKNKRIGTLTLTVITKNKALLSDLFVDEEFRRRGIAKHLIKKALHYCWKNNIRYVVATALSVASANLLKELGFRKTGKSLFYLNVKKYFEKFR